MAMLHAGKVLSEPSFLLDDGRVTVFSYGSNSTAQLRARVQAPQLVSTKASAPGYSRVFCLASPGWGGGGVASLSPDPHPDAVTYGAVVELTPAEKKLLDGFEGNYREEVISVIVHHGGDIEGGAGQRRSAIVYIAGKRNGDAYTLPMTVRPKMEYLTAIHCMLREHWHMQGDALAMRSCEAGGSVVVHDHWLHPGPRHLTLHALCVEVNVLKPVDELWVMPKTIKEVVGKLEALGCDPQANAEQLLLPQFGGPTLDTLNEKLEAAGHKPFGGATMVALKQLLLGGPAGAQ